MPWYVCGFKSEASHGVLPHFIPIMGTSFRNSGLLVFQPVGFNNVLPNVDGVALTDVFYGTDVVEMGVGQENRYWI